MEVNQRLVCSLQRAQKRYYINIAQVIMDGGELTLTVQSSALKKGIILTLHRCSTTDEFPIARVFQRRCPADLPADLLVVNVLINSYYLFQSFHVRCRH